MRILLDVADADVSFVRDTREHDGQVILVGFGSQAAPAHVIGTAVPRAVVGQANRFTAFYDITLLEDM